MRSGFEGRISRAPKVRHKEYRTFGAHLKRDAYPGLTAGPNLWRLSEALRTSWALIDPQDGTRVFPGERSRNDFLFFVRAKERWQ